MSVWNFLGEVALFELIRRWFSIKRHTPAPIPSVIPPRPGRHDPVGSSRCSVDELHDRVDALESELDDLDIMSERYDDIQDRIDLLLDRIDEMEEMDDEYLMAEDDY